MFMQRRFVKRKIIFFRELRTAFGIVTVFPSTYKKRMNWNVFFLSFYNIFLFISVCLPSTIAIYKVIRQMNELPYL